MIGSFIFSLIAAFISGLLIFLLPCNYPILSGYISIIGASSTTRRVIANTIAFLLGFSIVAILFFTLLNAFLAPYRILITQIGGVLILLFGLTTLGLVAMPSLFKKNVGIKLPANFMSGEMTVVKSAIIGSVFSFAWTPCIGPIFGSVLLLATSNETFSFGVFLLLAFFAGMSLPLLVLSYIYAKSFSFPTFSNSFFKRVQIASGILLIIVGILLMTQNLGIFEIYLVQTFSSLEHYVVELEEKILEWTGGF